MIEDTKSINTGAKPGSGVKILGWVIAVPMVSGLLYATYLVIEPYLVPYGESPGVHVFSALAIEAFICAIFSLVLIGMIIHLQGKTFSSHWAEVRQKAAQDKAITAEKQRLIDVADAEAAKAATLTGVLSVVHQTPAVFKYYSKDKTVGIAVDGEAGQVAFAVRADDLKVSMRRYQFADILAVELLQDGSLFDPRVWWCSLFA